MTDNSSTALLPALVSPAAAVVLPAIVEAADERARRRFVEFFTAAINNDNTRAAYARCVADFCRWVPDYARALEDVDAVIIAAYVAHLQRSGAAAPSVKQALSAITMLFDYLVLGHVVPFNPAASVRGPKHVVRRGKTPVLADDETRQLLDSIDTSELIGLRDRALIGVMVYTFARVSAAAGMTVGSYFATGKRWTIRIREKGGKVIEVPAHHVAESISMNTLRRPASRATCAARCSGRSRRGRASCSAARCTVTTCSAWSTAAPRAPASTDTRVVTRSGQGELRTTFATAARSNGRSRSPATNHLGQRSSTIERMTS